eukprot:1894967-Amphidinium_carterae.6
MTPQPRQRTTAIVENGMDAQLRVQPKEELDDDVFEMVRQQYFGEEAAENSFYDFYYQLEDYATTGEEGQYKGHYSSYIDTSRS